METSLFTLQAMDVQQLLVQVILYLRYGILLLLGALAALALAVTWKG